MVIFGDDAFHHLQHGFIQRGVDDLALAGGVARMQRRKNAHAAIGGSQRIADRNAHAARRPVGFADDIAPAAHRLADAAKAGAV